jgi:hypothetical protein
MPVKLVSLHKRVSVEDKCVTSKHKGKRKSNVRRRESRGTHKYITRQAFKTKKKHFASEIRLNGNAKKELGLSGLI